MKKILKMFCLPWWIALFPKRSGFHPYFGPPTLPYGGPDLKLRKLKKAFGNSYWPSVIYVVSGKPLSLSFLTLAKNKGIPIVLNQDGVYYPAWYSGSCIEKNQVLASLHALARFVVFQSRYCEASSRQWVSSAAKPHSILYNGVDGEKFTPRQPPLPLAPFRLLACSYFNASNRYVLEALFKILSDARQRNPKIELLIAGKVEGGAPPRWPEGVTYLGSYTQDNAPQIYQKAHVLLHLKYMDPCPSAVLEAMACGLPVIYSQSGGTPELVGDAGIGLPVPSDYEKIHMPETSEAVQAVLDVQSRWSFYSQAARQRATASFALKTWLHEHERLLKDPIGVSF